MMKSLLMQMPTRKCSPLSSDRVFEMAGAVGNSISGRCQILRLICFTVVNPLKLRLMYDLAVVWVSSLTLPSIFGGCDNTPSMLGCVRCEGCLTQVL
jgi:hypothetical protein